MKNKGIIFGIIGIVVLVLSLIAGIFLVKQNQDFREKAAPATSLYITPSSQTKSPSDSFTVKVMMDTGANLVTGIDLRLSFETNNIEVTSISKGAAVTNLDTTITNNVNNSQGKIAFAIFTLDAAKAVTGTGLEALIINGKIKDSAINGSSIISFEPATSASGSNEGVNIITGTTPGTIIINSAENQNLSATATATGNSTATSTATATSIATSTATSTGNSQNQNQAQKTKTPTATATATSNSANKTATSNATQTPFPIPVSGFDWPTFIGVGLGAITILTSLLLVF